MEVIDTLGGVTIINQQAFEYGGFTFPEGEIRLHSGKEAMEYVRMRYDDPRGDFGRQERQREIVRGILNEAAQFENAWKINQLLNALSENVQTNLQMEDMIDIQRHYRPAMNEIYYYVVPEASIKEWSSRLRHELAL
ncbi:LCP family protein [Jeotgalibacillus malaysiensis]|uniref:LCP family glycopolymer transferase n=1 Tax=Jeotgalibacillus malaysiensis TaxID=1508404 RepID=UPI00384F18C4